MNPGTDSPAFLESNARETSTRPPFWQEVIALPLHFLRGTIGGTLLFMLLAGNLGGCLFFDWLSRPRGRLPLQSAPVARCRSFGGFGKPRVAAPVSVLGGHRGRAFVISDYALRHFALCALRLLPQFNARPLLEI